MLHVLPIEIWLDILRIASADRPVPRGTYKSGWTLTHDIESWEEWPTYHVWTLTHVCHDWRKWVMSDGKFWSHFVVRKVPRVWRAVASAVWKTELGLAGQHPLIVDFEITGNSRWMLEQLDVFLQYQAQWVDARISLVGYDTSSKVFQGRTFSMPLLKILRIGGSLKPAELYMFPLSNLKELKCTVLDHPKLFVSLSALHHVEDLILNVHTESPDTLTAHFHPVDFAALSTAWSNLRSLKLSGPGTLPTAKLVFQNLTLPNLSQLALTEMHADIVPILIPFLQRCGSSLLDLTIRGIVLVEAHVLELLPHLSRVQNLKLYHDCDWSAQSLLEATKMLRALTIDNSQPALCPRLQRLTVRSCKFCPSALLSMMNSRMASNHQPTITHVQMLYSRPTGLEDDAKVLEWQKRVEGMFPSLEVLEITLDTIWLRLMSRHYRMN